MTDQAPEEARSLRQRGWSVVCALLMTAGALGIVGSRGAAGDEQPLAADAGPDQTVNESDTVLLDGSGSVGSTSVSPPSGLLFDSNGNDVGASTTDVRALATGDLDNDGDVDIVSGSGSGEDYELIVWENDGTPFSGLWPQHDVGATQDMLWSIAVADMDKDGDLDIVTGTGADEDYQLIAWENDGIPFDGTWPQHDLGVAVLNVFVALADLDGDSWFDIVTVESAYGPYGDVTIWRNDGTPFVGLWSGNALVSDWALAALEVADLDSDGDVDILYTYHEYYVRALENDGTPFDGGWASNYVGYGGPGMVTGLETSDFDKDGYTDIATGTAYNPARPQYVFRNDHTPFSGSWPSNTYYTVSAITVAAADFDLDGDNDFVTSSHIGWTSFHVVVRLND